MEKNPQTNTISSNDGKLEISMNESVMERTIKNFINIYIDLFEKKHQ